MEIAIVCKDTAYGSLLMLARTVLANPEPMLARLVYAAASPSPSLLAHLLINPAAA